MVNKKMMKKIEWFWNLVYYNLYRFYLEVVSLFKYLSPFYWIYKLPKVKERYAKQGIDDMYKFMNSTLSDSKKGPLIAFVGSFMGCLLVLIECGVFNIILTITGWSWINYISQGGSHIVVYLLFLLVTIILINRHLLFKKDKYLIYFEEFEKMTGKKKTMYGWLCFFVVILICFFFIGSFYLNF